MSQFASTSHGILQLFHLASSLDLSLRWIDTRESSSSRSSSSDSNESIIQSSISTPPPSTSPTTFTATVRTTSVSQAPESVADSPAPTAMTTQAPPSTKTTNHTLTPTPTPTPSDSHAQTSFTLLSPVYLGVGALFILVLAAMAWLLMVPDPRRRPWSCRPHRNGRLEDVPLRRRGPGDAYEVEPRMWSGGGRFVGERTRSRSQLGSGSRTQEMLGDARVDACGDGGLRGGGGIVMSSIKEEDGFTHGSVRCAYPPTLMESGSIREAPPGYKLRD